MFIKLQMLTMEAKSLREGKLDGPAAIMLVKLLMHMNKNNMVKGAPADLVQELGVSRWEFTKGIKALKASGVVRKYAKKEYMVNPAIAYNGDEQHYGMVKYMWDTQTLRSKAG